jgi:hypothetical protein
MESCLPSFEPAGVSGGDCTIDATELCALLEPLGVLGASLSLEVCCHSISLEVRGRKNDSTYP